MANNNVLKIGAQELAALAKSMKEQAKEELEIARRSSHIRGNEIFLPFVPKDYEDDDRYGSDEDDLEDTGKGTQARLTSKQKREAFDKFVIDWRKQNSLEGTDVMPPNEVVPLWMRRAEGKNEDMTIAGGPSFDINETPATRRIRKIRTLQERGVGGEKGNAGDILKKGIQLPNLQASALDDLLSPHQNPRSGSLRDSGLSNAEKRELLIRGTKLPQA